jgi:hypothetical protein
VYKLGTFIGIKKQHVHYSSEGPVKMHYVSRREYVNVLGNSLHASEFVCVGLLNCCVDAALDLLYNSTCIRPYVVLKNFKKQVKSKAIPVTGRGGVWGCDTLRIPHCLDNRLTDGGNIVIPTHRPRSAVQKHYLSADGTHFC